MACLVRPVAKLSDVESIRRSLFPIDDKRGSECWLSECSISVSPIGDVIVLAHERRLVILTSRWDCTTSSSQFQITFSGVVDEIYNVKAVLCLPIVGQTKSSHVNPDWCCIVLGFESGHIRIYTETCELLYEEQFHNECITSIKCQSQHNPRPDISLDSHLEEIYIQYQSNVCVVSGNQLFPLLRNYRAQLARVQANSELLEITNPTVNARKWSFQDQSIINDIAVVGLTMSNTFDHLLTASTCGGFDSKFRSIPPNHTLVLGAGSKPFLGFHYAIEGGSQPVLTDVAKAVAHKLKSALPGWLTGNQPAEKRLSTALQPADQMGCRFGLCDIHRTANSIILSPDHKLAAISDSLGRVILVDTEKGVALKILKGYRDAQCSFIQVPDERRSKHKIGNKVALFLIIYSTKKGTIEIFTTQLCTRVTTFSASKYSRLIYISYGLMGFSQPVKSKYICQFTTILIDNDGQMKEILIPFHFALSEKNNKRARDIHLFKKLKQLIKCDSYDHDILLTETLSTAKELKTVELKAQLIDLLSTTKNLPVEILLKCAQYFIDNSTTEEEEDTEAESVLRIKVSNILSVLNFYLFLHSPIINGDLNRNNCEDLTHAILKLESREVNNLQKLLDLSTISENKNSSELRVTFSDEGVFPLSMLLSIFDLTQESFISILPNHDENIIYKVSEILFHEYISQQKNYKHFAEEVVKSKIITRDLYFLLMQYWINRPLSIHLNLEVEMNYLTSMLYILVKTSKDIICGDVDVLESLWREIRAILADSNRTFPALTAAMLCKYVAYKIERERDLEQSTNSLDDEDIEIWSQENIEWTLLIGNLEDVSLLNILLTNKPSLSQNCSLPKLSHDKMDVSLKYVMQKKGSVSELVARWLTMSGIDPEYLLINEKINKPHCEVQTTIIVDANSSESVVSFSGEEIAFIQSETLFEHLNMIRNQWPYSLESGMILANMSWEYIVEWKKDIQQLAHLEACISCLKQVSHFFVRLGLFNLVWKTHLMVLFENTTKLLNKVGKIPKDRLCKQDTGLSDLQVSVFISICTDYLDAFTDIVQEMHNVPKEPLHFEPVWENEGQTLAELAIQQTNINYELLLAHYQLSLVFQMLCTFSIKSVKPINNLFDSEVVNVLFNDFQGKHRVDYSRTDSKLTAAREQFLTKVISLSVENITVKDNEIYTKDHVHWMSKCKLLGLIWDLDVDILRKHQVIQLFTYGYNIMAQDLSATVRDRSKLGVEMLSIAGKRMSNYVAASSNLGTQLAALTPTVTRYMETLNGEWCSESTLTDIIDLTTLSITCMDHNQPEYKLAILLLEACTTLRDLGE